MFQKDVFGGFPLHLSEIHLESRRGESLHVLTASSRMRFGHAGVENLRCGNRVKTWSSVQLNGGQLTK